MKHPAFDFCRGEMTRVSKHQHLGMVVNGERLVRELVRNSDSQERRAGGEIVREPEPEVRAERIAAPEVASRRDEEARPEPKRLLS